MRPREITLLSLLFCIDILTHITGLKAVSNWVLVYVIASLVFIYLPKPDRFVLGVVIFESVLTILDMMVNYWFWISAFTNIQLYYWGDLWIRSDKAFLTYLICIPLQKITQLYGAKYTVQKWRLRERVGKF